MDAIRECLEIGQSQGIAKQKAKDEKRFAKITAQKDAEIAELKTQLEKLKCSKN